MIGSLRGSLLDRRPRPSGGVEVLVEVGGVGYRVVVPSGAAGILDDLGAPVFLHVHTHVREDALQLFGFATGEERAVFERLLTVSGIGPRLAVTILSGLPLPELVAAIAAQDVRRLVTIPGVGRKLAERLSVELRDKVAGLAGAPASAAAPPSLTTLAEDAVGALLNLGYKRAQAESAVTEAAGDGPGLDLQGLLAAALRRLSR